MYACIFFVKTTMYIFCNRQSIFSMVNNSFAPVLRAYFQALFIEYCLFFMYIFSCLVSSHLVLSNICLFFMCIFFHVLFQATLFIKYCLFFMSIRMFFFMYIYCFLGFYILSVLRRWKVILYSLLLFFNGINYVYIVR